MRRGFSLLEVVIVLALIALVSGLIVVNAEGMLRGLGREPVERVLQKAVREARFQAASIKEPAYLVYSQQQGSLIIFDDSGQQLADFSVAAGKDAQNPEIEFEQVLPVMGLDSFSTGETVKIKQVVFRPDRSSTPFQVIIRDSDNAFIQRYDPFSAIIIDDSRSQ